MDEMDFSVDPRLVAAACVPATGDSVGRQLVLAVDLFCLVTGGRCWLQRGPERAELGPNTLALVRAGEDRFLQVKPRSRPQLWMVYFQAGRRLYEQLPALSQPDSWKRIWRLGEPEAACFKDLFIKLTVERAGNGPQARQAEAGWLTLLMVSAQRWGEPARGPGCHTLPPKEAPSIGLPTRDGRAEALDSDVLRRRFRFLSRRI